ncbi:MAG: hypothetical protein ABI728_03215 [Betaproteobacteria bacterium]
MPRKPRLHLLGGLYHVILRGNDRQDIFFEDEDRMFDTRTGVARSRYARFVAEGMSEGHRPEFYRGSEESRVVGEDRFVERALRANAESVRRHGADLDHIVAYVCQGSGLTEQELSRPGKNRLASQARALIGWLAAGSGGASLSQVARRLKRDVSNVSRAVTQLERIAAEGGTRATSLHMHKIAISQT